MPMPDRLETLAILLGVLLVTLAGTVLLTVVMSRFTGNDDEDLD